VSEGTECRKPRHHSLTHSSLVVSSPAHSHSLTHSHSHSHSVTVTVTQSLSQSLTVDSLQRSERTNERTNSNEFARSLTHSLTVSLTRSSVPQTDRRTEQMPSSVSQSFIHPHRHRCVLVVTSSYLCRVVSFGVRCSLVVVIHSVVVVYLSFVGRHLSFVVGCSLVVRWLLVGCSLVVRRCSSLFVAACCMCCPLFGVVRRSSFVVHCRRRCFFPDVVTAVVAVWLLLWQRLGVWVIRCWSIGALELECWSLGTSQSGECSFN